jgi:hypothetical protein
MATKPACDPYRECGAALITAGFPSIDRLGRETFLFNQWVVECVITPRSSPIRTACRIAKRILYVYGYVRYYDLFKVMRRTGFLFEYIATEMRQKKVYL